MHTSGSLYLLRITALVDLPLTRALHLKVQLSVVRCEVLAKFGRLSPTSTSGTCAGKAIVRVMGGIEGFVRLDISTDPLTNPGGTLYIPALPPQLAERQLPSPSQPHSPFDLVDGGGPYHEQVLLRGRFKD